MAMKLSSFLLRLGLAFSFAYAAADSFINPDAWIGFFPLIIRNLMTPSLLLIAFALLQAGLALWLISGKAVFYSAIFSALILFGIIIVNLGQLEIIFRDVTILFAALALAAAEAKAKFLSSPKEN